MKRLLIGLLFVSSLAGCGGGGGTSAGPSLAGTPTLPVSTPTPPISTPAVNASLYVANSGGNNVLGFSLPISGNVAPVLTISSLSPTDPTSSPTGIFVDASGKIYVADNFGSDILVFAPGANGNATPLQRIAGDGTRLVEPTGVVVDSTGRIYVTDPTLGLGATYIFAYSSGATGAQPPFQSFINPLDYPTDVILDRTGSNVIVVDASSGHVSTFPLQSNGTVVTTASSDLRIPEGQLYVQQIALDAAGKLYVTMKSTNSVLVYAAGASGTAAPVATISGASTGLNQPCGIAVDPSTGTIYVSNEGDNSIRTFAAGANGNVAPTAVLAGPATLLNAPSFLAFH